MDEGKATRPKPKWWSRPRRASEPRPPGEQPVPYADAAPGGPHPAAAEPAAPTGAGVRAHAPAGTPADRTAGGDEPDSGTPAADRTEYGDAEHGAGRTGRDDAGRGEVGSEDVGRDDAGTPVPAADEPPPGGETPPGAGHTGPDAGRSPVQSTGQSPPRNVQPLHAEDPYRTPPYGGPGPWAPAPPVQLPGSTPPHGVSVPAGGIPGIPGTPAHGTPVPAGHGDPAPHTSSAPHGSAPVLQAPTPRSGGPQPAVQPTPWLRYDPWAPPPAGPHGAQAAPEPRRRTLSAGALLLALVAGVAGGALGAYAERHGGFSTVELPQAPAEKSGGRAPGSVAGIAEAVLPGVVTLRVAGGGGEGTGTGFLLDDRGHILTNHHVVEPAGDGGEVQVTFHRGQAAVAEVVGADAGYDLAVVKVEGVSGMEPLALGNSDSVRVGDPVVAIGAPYDLEGTVTTGIISAKGRPITAGGEEEGGDVSYVDALQTDASINPGNSGGPLVDSKGRVIGINSAIKAADSGFGFPGAPGGSIGLGFAIPVNQAKRVAEELINTGSASHPVLGVTLDMAYAGDGARVVARDGGRAPVTPGGPGDKAGIEPEDVITAVDGARVHSGEELIVKVRSHRPGDRLELTLERDGEKRTVRLTLGASDGR